MRASIIKYYTACKVSVFAVFLVLFSHIRTEYWERSIFPYSVRMRENADQKNSEYGHLSDSVLC